MLIKSITIPEGHRDLKGCTLSGLGRLVILAGPNGGGKTRILDSVAEFCSNFLLPKEREILLSQKRDLQNHIESTRSRLPSLGVAKQENHSRAIEQWEREVANIDKRIEAGSSIEFSDDLQIGIKPTVVAYNVGSLELRDWKNYRFDQIEDLASTVQQELGLTLFNERLLATIYSVGHNHRMMAQGRAEGAIDADNQALVDAAARYKSLTALVREFLGTELSWIFGSGGGPSLFGKPIALANLSLGQRVLLSIATSPALQDGSKQELIVLMDEPENHLHPSALNEMLEMVIDKCPHAQFWIATHSVHVLAQLQDSTTISVVGGKASGASRGLETVLNSLLGDESGLSNLRDLLASPAEAAIVRFASQCLLPPAIADTQPGDPQTNQIVSILQSKTTQSRPLRLIDFGAGKGRLLGELIAAAQGSGVELSALFDFYAVDHVDVPPDVEATCRERIAIGFPGDARERYFKSDGAFGASLNPSSVDVVVMCNVLHEIPPQEWLRVIGPNSAILRVLADDGHLLVVEDQQLRVGERAHDYNFLVLDTQELRSLCALLPESTDIRTVTHPIARYSSRLKAHLIPKAALARITNESRRSALLQLAAHAKDEASRLQRAKTSEEGQLYGFWTMQYLNATLAAESF